MSFLLALDQGTSSSRSIVFDASGRIVAMAQREFRQIFPHPGWVEHDPMEIWASQRATMLEVMAEAGLQARDIAAIGITMKKRYSSSGMLNGPTIPSICSRSKNQWPFAMA